MSSVPSLVVGAMLGSVARGAVAGGLVTTAVGGTVGRGVGGTVVGETEPSGVFGTAGIVVGGMNGLVWVGARDCVSRQCSR